MDLLRLLSEGRGGFGFQDPVWELASGGSNSLILIPLTVSDVNEETVLSRSPVAVRGARFVGFAVPARQDRFGGGGQDIDFSRFTRDDPEAFDDLLFGEPEPDGADGFQEPMNNAPGFDEFGNSLGGAVSDSPYPAVPASAPRLARRVTLYPDGSVGWLLDRSLPGMEVRQGGPENLYPYKLDPDLLREQEPGRGERLERQPGEDARDFAARRRQQQLEEREKMEAYRELRDSLRDLPTEFREPVPDVIYAVFDADSSGDLTLQGEPPLPWTLDRAKLELITRISNFGGAGRAGTGLSEEQRLEIDSLLTMINQGSQLDHRAAAVSVLRGGLAGMVSEHDRGYELIGRLLASDDGVARRIALYAVAQTNPPTRASARLLEQAGRSADGPERELLQLASLRAMFQVDAGKPDNTGFLVTQVNEALANPDGPPAARVIEELLLAVDQISADGAGDLLERVAVVMVNRLDFEVVPDDQLDAVIAAVIRSAPTNAIAAGWLDIKLLRGSSDRLIDRTLELLSQADAGSTLVRPLSESLRSAVFAEPSGDAATDRLDLTLSDTIPLDSANHGLVRAFDSTDPRRRALAWQVLRHFRVVATRSAAELSGVHDTEQQTFNTIIAKGLSEPEMPGYLVDFIDNQRGGASEAAATARMLDLLMEPGLDPSVAERAARKIVTSDRDYGSAMRQLESSVRVRTVQTLYAMLTGEVPMITALAHDEGGAMIDWFARQLQQGELPTAAQWAQAAADPQQGGEQRLLQAAVSQNPDVAGAAAAALVISASGTPADQNRFAQVILAMPDRSSDAVAAEWDKIKTQLYARALASAQGSYRVVISVYDTSGGQNGFDEFGNPVPDSPSRRPLSRTELGVVELKASGTTLSLSVQAIPVEVSSERLAIRLTDASTLRSFNHPDLSALPLSQITEPVDLLPREDGSWVGEATMPDGREIVIALEPAG